MVRRKFERERLSLRDTGIRMKKGGGVFIKSLSVGL